MNRLEFKEQASFKAPMLLSGIQNFIHDSEHDLPFPNKVQRLQQIYV